MSANGHWGRRALLAGPLILGTVAVMPPRAAAGEPPSIRHTLVATHRLPIPGQGLTAITVELAPGAKSPSHRHAGFVFACVLAGTVRSQLNDGPAGDYHTGDSWAEPLGTLHTLTENPSATEPARLLADFVAPSGATLTTAAR